MLSLEERGAYNTVLDLIYTKDGRVLDDDRFLAGWMRVDVRIWRRLRRRLIDLGKLYVAGEYLRNERADAEVDSALSRVASAEEAGRASAAKREAERRIIKGLAPTSVERTPQLPTTTSTSRKNTTTTSLPRNRAREDSREGTYFNGQRGDLLQARIAERFGSDGWKILQNLPQERLSKLIRLEGLGTLGAADLEAARRDVRTAE